MSNGLESQAVAKATSVLRVASTIIADVIAEGMASGKFRKDDHWEITFEIGALSHDLIMLYLGGRMAISATGFRALHRSFRRYIHGICC